MDKLSNHKIYEFGNFSLDTDHLMLYRGSEEVLLPPKVIETLLALIERNGEILSKDELMDVIWKDSVVEESNLSQYLHLLRKTLGVQQDGKPFIETFRRRGYRFNCNLKIRMNLLETKQQEQHSLIKQDRSGRSIAVLPFADMSENKDQDYFCEGISEELINALAHVPGIKVASRVSSFQFKNPQADIREIGSKLAVDTVLEGSVRKSEDRLRISAQLVNIADGYHLWSEVYSRELQDIFEIQEDIAQSIVRALSGTLLPPQQQAIKKQRADVQAYDLYLRGMHFTNRFTMRDNRFAVEMFQRAIAIDPQYAPAYAELAGVLCQIYLYWERSEDHLRLAGEASRRALELAPDSVEAMLAYAYSCTLQSRYPEAEQFFQKALSIDPNDFSGNYLYGRALWAEGKLKQAVTHMEKAMEVRPDEYRPIGLLSSLYRAQGMNEQAMKSARIAKKNTERWLTLNPDDVLARYHGALALAALGERKHAMEWADMAVTLSPNDPATLYNIACVYALLEEPEKALDMLERAVDVGFGHRRWIENDGDFLPFRDHPRFRAILEKLPYQPQKRK